MTLGRSQKSDEKKRFWSWWLNKLTYSYPQELAIIQKKPKPLPVVLIEKHTLKEKIVSAISNRSQCLVIQDRHCSQKLLVRYSARSFAIQMVLCTIQRRKELT